MARILTITNWYPPHHYGGYELSCFDVMTRLAERGHQVRVLCGDERVPGAAEPDVRHEGLVHRELQLYLREGALYRPGMRERLAIERHNHLALERHLGEHQPDVVSVWHMGAMSLGLLHRLADRGVPTVYAVCDDWLTYGQELDAWSRPFAGNPLRRGLGRLVEAATGVPVALRDPGENTAFCFVSASTRQRSVAHGPWMCPRSTVVYSGIDRSDFPPLGPVADRSWRWRLLYTGRFDARKGIETLLHAMAHLPPEATLECYGRGGADEQTRLAKLAADLGVTDRVTFGSLDRHELATRYADADVFVFPSEWEEPFGLVPIEAMACGTPVVATATGGSGEFLRDGYNCVAFHPGDPRALAAAIHRLHDHPDLRRRVVQGGLHTADELDVERLADTFEDWHMAAADDFAGGEPADRRLDLPDPSATDPLSHLQAAAPDVIAEGDPDAIKRLYADLGDHWWRARAEALEGIPVLSAPETRPVVARCLAGIAGLALDAGCGPNPALSIALGAEPGRTVVSVDVGWGTVRVAREVAARQGVALLGVVGDVEHLPFRDGTFASVACDDTVEHLADDSAGVAELARVLGARGRAVLATPNREDLRVLCATVRDRMRGVRKPARAYYCSNSQRRVYSWRDFERLVAGAFRIRARHIVGWERGWRSRFATRLVRVTRSRRVSQMIVLEVDAA
ncbi:MAG TPA: glycosyltransferase [Acidimicrobiia bacterium]|nr:glycosyltransferase [Acidimicrobiia bacterium]